MLKFIVLAGVLWFFYWMYNQSRELQKENKKLRALKQDLLDENRKLKESSLS